MNIIIKKYLILLNVFLSLYGCTYYQPVRFARAVNIDNFDGKTASARDYFKEENHSLFEKENSGYNVRKGRKGDIFYLKRYFADVLSGSPVARLNNRGVDYAVSGRFKEAEYLFSEAVKEDNRFAPAYNNLGIIHELFMHHDEACRMYTKACIIDPENEHYRRNFLFSGDKKNLSAIKSE